MEPHNNNKLPIRGTYQKSNKIIQTTETPTAVNTTDSNTTWLNSTNNRDDTPMELSAKYTIHHIPDIQMDDSPEVRNKIICNPTNWKKEVANDSEISKISRQNFF